jgi:hypothetical protein
MARVLAQSCGAYHEFAFFSDFFDQMTKLAERSTLNWIIFGTAYRR